MRHTPSVFTRLRSAWSVVLTLSFCLVDTWFSLIDFKEVAVHWTHGNAVINHTLCVFWWLIFQFPRSPVSCPSLGRYWCLAPDINWDSNVSSVKTDFRCKRSFLSIAGAKVQQFWAENKNMAKKVRNNSVSSWFITIYTKADFAFHIPWKTKGDKGVIKEGCH